MSIEERRLADRYVLGDRIGHGGMGQVWRGTDLVLGREVAVKAIDLTKVPDESAAARFEREARVTAGMSHPNVVTVHDSGVEGDTAYLVMELLPGPSLAEHLADGPLPIEEVIEVGRQVASALEAAHARGLVHRDIKPANIAYAADGRVRVLDFGITQLADTTGSHSLTATHTVMGTAEYLAPEQALGGRVDGRADLYALGCVLYALLVGGPPFRGATAVATMMMHANDPVPDVREGRPDTPGWLADLVTSLLAKDPDGRPAGARAVVQALTAHRAPEVAPTVAMSPVPAAVLPPVSPPAPPVTDPARRGSSWPLVVIALVAVVALALLGWQVLAKNADPGAIPSTTPSVATSAPPTTASPQTSAPEPTPTLTPTPTPTPTPSPSTSPSQDPGQGVTDGVAALTSAVRVLQRDGTLDPKPAQSLDDGLAKVTKALRGSDPQKVSSQTTSFVADYDKEVQDGSISPDASAALDPLVADLTAAVSSYAP
ncbi:MAG: serine/threonine-protein kinase [Ornithinibacter sp.]